MSDDAESQETRNTRSRGASRRADAANSAAGLPATDSQPTQTPAAGGRVQEAAQEAAQSEPPKPPKGVSPKKAAAATVTVARRTGKKGAQRPTARTYVAPTPAPRVPAPTPEEMAHLFAQAFGRALADMGLADREAWTDVATPLHGKQPLETSVRARARATTRASKKNTDDGPTPPPPAPTKVSPRQTLPNNAGIAGGLPFSMLPRRQYEEIDLTTLTSAALTPQQIIDLLGDAWPEESQALWNFRRLCHTNYQFVVRAPNSEREDTEGQAALQTLIKRLNPQGGGVDGLIDQFVTSVVLQGACAGETVATPDLDDVDDIVAVVPWSIFFQRDDLQHYVPFQWQPMVILPSTASNYGAQAIADLASRPPSANVLLGQSARDMGGYRELNTATFAYVPLDPVVDDPYGTAPFASVLQLVAWDAQLISDLRRWSHIHAWGRLDISVVAEMAQNLMPPAVRANKEKNAQWLRDYLGAIANAYASLNPDDVFVHWDNIQVSGAEAGGGNGSASGTFQIDALVRILERRVIRALKMLPVLMGSNEGTTETHGTVQMEVFSRGIASIQRVVATLLARLFEAALRIQGRAASVEVEFEPVRSTDRIKDATAEQLEIKNAAAKRDEGWITQDDAAMEVTGHKAEQPGPEPDQMIAPDQPDQDAALTESASQDAEQQQPAADDTQDAQDGQDGQKDQKGQENTKGAAVVGRAADANSEGDDGEEKDPTVGYEPFPPTYHQQIGALRAQMANYFGDLNVSEQVLRHIYELHTDRAIAANKHTAPALARAVAGCIQVRDARNGPYPYQDISVRLTDDERAALIWSIMKMLEASIPDADTRLSDLLFESHVATWNHAGDAALARMGYEGQHFSLTNAALRIQTRTTSDAHVQQIQQASRRTLATTIADQLQAGSSFADVKASVSVEMLHWRSLRAQAIAETETTDAWGSAELEVYGRNGISYKAWATEVDPDPICRANAYAGAIPIGQPFPSGHQAPTAHTRCHCRLVPAGNPADLANATPWTGA